MSVPIPHVDGVEHRYVEARGLRFQVAEAGAGEPLVLLHGWPQHWYLWREVIAPLAERYRVICPDLRGFGWSVAPPDGYEKENLADDVIALIEALGLGRVRLAGHDWGGFVGFLVCLRRPDLVERFLALNIIHPWQSLTPGGLLDLWRPVHIYVLSAPLIGERLLRHVPGLVRRLLSAAAVRPDAFTRAELEAFAAPLSEPARARATVALYRAFLLRELPALLRGRYADVRLRVPTLLLFGTADWAISRRMLGGFEDHADDMRLELVPGTGHFIVDERPELVAERALEFFAEERTPAGTQP
jgi:pimeloyl-ACP methyl ester carboxylesterase